MPSARPLYLVWVRNDLRILDNPALFHASARARENGGGVVLAYVWDRADVRRWAPGAASRWWLHRSLQAFTRSLEPLNRPLLLLAGSPVSVLPTLAHELNVAAVYWNRRYEPAGMVEDAAVRAALASQGVEVAERPANYLIDPIEVKSAAGTPFKVFTPFWRHCTREFTPGTPLPVPVSSQSRSPGPRVSCATLASFDLAPRVPWAGGLEAAWKPGEAGGRERLNDFLEAHVMDYAVDRDYPGVDGISRLSPYLHFGELSVREAWHAVVRHAGAAGAGAASGCEAFLRQLFWREFAQHVLVHNPATPDQPLHPEFNAFPWRSEEGVAAWREGKTGYPIVDAALRELWTTGWMHNRTRMIVASFLVKDLLVHWRLGAQWFWDTLVDADLANNTFGWQWAAGCGADAAPYFRIFNPVTQGRRFDPDGAYVRRWVPELAALPTPYMHAPWTAPADSLAKAGVTLGRGYPAPIVDHAEARRHALDLFKGLRGLR